MSNHQIHFERKFYLHKASGYWISCDYSKERPRIRAHQWIWINHHGPIPKGYHLHHKNEDKSDNRIENLELIEASRHFKHHYYKDPSRAVHSKESIDKIRPLTKKWHASEEGKAWHAAHGIITWLNREPFKIKCQICSKEVETKTFHQKFCHPNCKAKALRKRRREAICDNKI